ncbi:alpha/beta fold hydrolase [Rhodococcus sp. NPDC055024]
MLPFPSEALRKVAEADAIPADRARLMLAMAALLHDPEMIRPDVLDEMHSFRSGAHEWFDALGRSPVVRKDNTAALETYSVPTQLIWGSLDRMVPVKHGFRLLNHVNAGELIILPQCGHWVPFECPDAYAGQVQRFLRQHLQAR